jgi:hypothetical protein
MALGFDITDFRASINNKGVVRNHSYMVSITPPSILSDYDASQLTLRCDSLNMPGMNLMTQDGIYRYGYGPAEIMPYNAMYTPVTMSFIIDRVASQYTFFNIWMNRVFDTNISGGILPQDAVDSQRDRFGNLLVSAPYEVSYKQDYATEMHLFVYNEVGDKVIELNFVEAYPMTIQDTPLSWGLQQDVVRLQVTMAYKGYFMKTLEGYPDITRRAPRQLTTTG